MIAYIFGICQKKYTFSSILRILSLFAESVF